MARVLTGLALAAAYLALAFLAPAQAFIAVLVLAALAALHEFYGIAAACELRPLSKAGLAGALLWLLPIMDRGYSAALLALALLGAAALSGLEVKKILPSAAVTLTGVLYVMGPMYAAISLHLKSPHWLILAIATVAVGDVFALAVGKLIGRRRLAPVLSPNKTWEGTIASVLASLLVGSGYAALFLEGQISLPAAAALALALNVAGQLGDLVESALKRAANLKDSGTLLPGHGGLLDRVDGLLFAVPVAYGYLQLA